MSLPRRALPDAPARRGWCPGLRRPMPTGDGLLARVHPPLGILTLAQARAVAEGARRFGNGHVDVTARANLQVRGVREATRVPLARLLEAAGLGDARADGGPQRLTLTGPLAGWDPAETIDVPGLACAIEAEARAIPGLPAKTLVAVDGRPGPPMADADFFVRASGRDRVAIAVADDEGARDVLACGADEAAAAVAALLAAFARTGRRRARDLSAAERAALTASWRAEPPPPSAGEGGPRRGSGEGQRDGAGWGPVATSSDISLPSPALLRRILSPAEGGGRAPVPTPRAIPAPGVTPLAAGGAILAVDAPFGRCTADSLDRLAAIANDLGVHEIRLSPARGFVLLAADGARAGAQLPALAADFVVTPDDPRRAVAACTGAPACVSGTTPTLVDAVRLADAFRPFAARGLVAHVSGCAKGCARPAPADLTLVGRDGAYGIVLGGGPGDPPGAHLPIEAALERLGRAPSVGLAAAFAPDGTADRLATGCGRDRRPA